ncbi:uncharacterized protein LOC113793209 [Dermatophagoides pteronyssinus]|uniref:uncharacterized protein LOC113793209 n=1 Tax=Dermatophagoides pteronyssinus TaxID=6956 RepID=UPI003F675E30
MIEDQQEINNNSLNSPKHSNEIVLSSSSSSSTSSTSANNGIVSNNKSLFHIDSSHHLDDETVLNDWIELSDENVRIKKQYEKLRCEYNDLEFRFESVMTEKSTLNQLLQQQAEQLWDLKKTLNNSIDLNEYERLRQDLEHSNGECRELVIQNKILCRNLVGKESELQRLQTIVDELGEQNTVLREQIMLNGENREMTTKLLCDIESMQTKISEYLISITDLSDENQELRRLLDEQYNHRNHDLNRNLNQSSTTLTSHCPSYIEVMGTPPQPLRQNNAVQFRSNNPLSSNSQINNCANDKLSVYNRCSYSILNLNQLPRSSFDSKQQRSSSSKVETMADVIIDDLGQQMDQMKSEIVRLESENEKLRAELEQRQQLIDSDNDDDEMDKQSESTDYSKPQPMALITHSPLIEDRSVQTDPIALTIESKKFIRCPLDHTHNGINIDNVEQHNGAKQNHRRHRFSALASLVKSKSSHHHHYHSNHFHPIIKQQSTIINSSTTQISLIKSRKQQQQKKKRKRRLFCLF